MRETTRFFKAAGYVFTYSQARTLATTRLDLWREDPVTGVRYWVTTTRCTADRTAVYAAAMALVAWVRSMDVPLRSSIQAQAVAESVALTLDRFVRLSARQRSVVPSIGRTAVA